MTTAEIIMAILGAIGLFLSYYFTKRRVDNTLASTIALLQQTSSTNSKDITNIKASLEKMQTSSSEFRVETKEKLKNLEKSDEHKTEVLEEIKETISELKSVPKQIQNLKELLETKIEFIKESKNVRPNNRRPVKS